MVYREYAGLYREILCKDCNKTSTATFHIVGMKCSRCGSYNTTLDKGPLLRLVSKEGEEPVYTPLTEGEIGALSNVSCLSPYQTMLVILLARGLTMRMAGRQLRRWWRMMMRTLVRWLKRIWTDVFGIIAYLLGIRR